MKKDVDVTLYCYKINSNDSDIVLNSEFFKRYKTLFK